MSERGSGGELEKLIEQRAGQFLDHVILRRGTCGLQELWQSFNVLALGTLEGRQEARLQVEAFLAVPYAHTGAWVPQKSDNLRGYLLQFSRHLQQAA